MSDQAMKDLVRMLACAVDGVESVVGQKVHKEPYGIILDLDLSIYYGSSAQSVLAEVQSAVSAGVEQYTAVNVLAANVRAVRVAKGLLDTGMPLRRYLPLCLAAGTAWASFGATIGWLGGTWMHDHPLLGVALAIGLGVVLGGLVDRLVQRFALEPEQEEPYAEVPAESDRSPDMIGR